MRPQLKSIVVAGLLSVLSSTVCLAAGDQAPLLFFGAGAIIQNAGRYSSDTSGNTKLTAAMYSALNLSGRFALSPVWGLAPTVLYTPLGRKSVDKGETQRLLAIGVRPFYELSSTVDVHFGPGVLLDFISGTGGTVSLNNGTGTSVFAFPSTSKTTRLFYLDAGIEFHLYRFKLEFDLITVGLLSGKRAYNPALTLSYGFY